MLKDLCLLNGTSGDELTVKDFIISQISQYCDYEVDALGSIIAYKKGAKKLNSTISFNAHMDEVGFIVTNITEEGYLKFQCVGGIDTRVVLNRKVLVNGIIGVIADKAYHLLSEDNKKSIPKYSELSIDIGAKNKEDAMKYVAPGDFVYFMSDYVEFGNRYIKAKALDDRIGCMYLINMIKSDLPFDSYFCFNVQEEVGLRGSQCTSFRTKPDIAFIIESTTASDISGSDDNNKMCSVESGPVISFMDNRTIYDKDLIKVVTKLATENNIKYQFKKGIAGGNDAGSIQRSGGATKVLAISLPCRYIHSSSSVVSKDDIDNSYKLVKTIAENLDVIENNCIRTN